MVGVLVEDEDRSGGSVGVEGGAILRRSVLPHYHCEIRQQSLASRYHRDSSICSDLMVGFGTFMHEWSEPE